MTKVIVERLKDIIPKLISPYQIGFVLGRNIHENIIVAHELVQTKAKGKKGYFAIKVDLAKPYDKISWEFICRTLEEIHLPQKTVNVIMCAITSIETNIK